MKKEVEKTIFGMTLWGEVHEDLKNKNMSYISKVDEIIFELNEKLKATMVKKGPNSLREHASLEDYVLKQLHEHHHSFLGKDGERIIILSIV